jgi:hypothetical protein
MWMAMWTMWTMWATPMTTMTTALCGQFDDDHYDRI